MVMILIDEVLHTTGNSTFFKTYDTVKDLYGIHTNSAGTFLEPVFLHIFKYESGMFVVVDQIEQFYGVDLKGNRLELSANEENRWQSVIIKSSTCNCVRTRTTHNCKYCGGEGNIPNSYGLKQLSSFF